MKKYQTFETERLLLRPTESEDAPFIMALLNMPKWLKYIGDRNVRSLKDAQNYINNKIKPQFARLAYGNYTVIRKRDGVKLGTCGLYDREGLSGVDIGFGFLPEYEKKGYALESSLKVMELAINDFKLKQINAITNKDNIASQNLLKKLGLRYIKMVKLPNSDEKLMLFQLK